MENSKSNRHLILIVDDSPINVEIMEMALEENYDIGTATNGQDALDFAREKRPNLILLDILMPEMDGYEVIRHLKASQQTKDIAVIFITALINEDKIVKGFELGAVDYITKPFVGAEVEARVKTHLALDDYKNRLEDKVQERTRDLEKAHQRLQKMEGLLTSVQTASVLNQQITQHLKNIVNYAETDRSSDPIISEVDSITELINEILDKVSRSYNEYAEEESKIGHDDLEKREF